MEKSTPPHEALLAEIEAFCERTGVAKTRIGNDALRDPNFLMDLERGRQPRWDTIERVRTWMADHEEKSKSRAPECEGGSQ